MECRVFDQTLTAIGSISNFVSMVWEEGYDTTGVFQFVVNKTPHSIDLLKEGRFLSIPDSDTLAFIRTVDDKDDQLWVYGIESKGILGYRVAAERAVCNNQYVEARLLHYIGEWCGDYDFLTVPAAEGLTATLDSEYSYASVLELCSDWCTKVGYGFRLVFDKATHKLVVKIYDGDVNSDVKFSRFFGNMSEAKMLVTGDDFYNCAYVAGAGTGTDRVVVFVDESGGFSGLYKRVMYVDARDIQLQSGETQEEYEARLAARGSEKLAKKQLVRSVSFKTPAKDYGRLYTLGDIIPVSIPEYGYNENVRIKKVRFTYESNTRTVDLTIG